MESRRNSCFLLLRLFFFCRSAGARQEVSNKHAAGNNNLFIFILISAIKKHRSGYKEASPEESIASHGSLNDKKKEASEEVAYT